MTVKQLHSKAWRLLKLRIQKRDFNWRGDGMCITCLKPLKINTQESHAGHFIHGKSKLTYYEPINVHYQCRQCNYYGSHKSVRFYERFMQRTYGMEAVEALEKKASDTQTWNKKLLETKIKELDEKRPD